MTFNHPADCKLCNGTLLEMRNKWMSGEFVIGVRICSKLKREGEPLVRIQAEPTPEGLCGFKHMLPGMDNKQLGEGGALCILKHEHKGDCQVHIEQATQTVVMAIPADTDESPRIVNTIPKVKA